MAYENGKRDEMIRQTQGNDVARNEMKDERK